MVSCRAPGQPPGPECHPETSANAKDSPVEKPEKTVRLGDILVRNGLITEEQLEEALRFSQGEGLRLGEALVRLGLIDPDAITWAMGHQFHLSFVELSRDMVDWPFLTSLPLDQLREIGFLPLNRVHMTVTGVVADPTRPRLREHIEELFPGLRLEIQMAAEQDIARMLDEAAAMRTLARPTEAASTRAHRSVDRWVSEWLQAIHSGAIAGLTLLPDESGNGDYRVLTPPDSHWRTVESITGEEMAELRARLASHFHPLLPAGPHFHGFMEGTADGAAVPLRLLVLQTLAGAVVSIAALPFAAPERRDPSPPLVLFSSRPDGLRREVEAFFQQEAENAPEGAAVFLDCFADHHGGPAFQAEIPGAEERGQLCRAVSEMLTPPAIVVEVNRPEELLHLPAEASAWPWTRLLALCRMPVATLPDVPAGWTLSLVDQEDQGLQALLGSYLSGA